MTKKQAMPYLKFHTYYMNDLQINRVPPSTRWRYLELYALAFTADSGGQVIDPETRVPLTLDDIAFLVRSDVSAVADDVKKLISAGLLTQNDQTLVIVRYVDEQINQAEYRKATAERVAKHRSKLTKPKETEAKEREFNSSVNQTKVKSNNDVTRYTRVTDDDEDIDLNADSILREWESLLKIPSREIEITVRKALKQGVEADALLDKIQSTYAACPENPVAYFTQCVKSLIPLEPTKEDVMGIVRRNAEIDSLDTLNSILREYCYSPITHEQAIEWGLEHPSN